MRKKETIINVSKTVETELNTQETVVETKDDTTPVETELNTENEALNESKKSEVSNFAVFCIKENKFAFVTEEQFDIYNHKRV